MCVAVERIVVGSRRLGVGWWLGSVCVWCWGGGYVAQVVRLLLLSHKA